MKSGLYISCSVLSLNLRAAILPGIGFEAAGREDVHLGKIDMSGEIWLPKTWLSDFVTVAHTRI